MVRLFLTLCLLFSFSSSVSAVTEGMSLFQVLNKYKEATAPRTVLSAIKSLKVQGRIVTSTGERKFIVVKKRPNRSMNIYFNDGGETVMAYDGDVVWYSPQGKISSQIIELEGLQKAKYIRGAQIEYFLYNHELYDCHVEYKGIVTAKNGSRAHLLECRFKVGDRVDVYLDESTYAMIQVDEYKTVDSPSPDSVILLKDHKKINKVTYALTTENYKNGKKTSTIYIDDVKENIGVFNRYFKKPVAIEK